MGIFEKIVRGARSFEPINHPFLSFILYLIGCVIAVFIGHVIAWLALGILLLPIIFIVFRAPIILFFKTQFRLIELLGTFMFAGLCAGLFTLAIRSQEFNGEDLEPEILTWMALSFVSVLVGSTWAWKKIYDQKITDPRLRWKLLIQGWVYALTCPLLIAFFMLLLPLK